MRPCLGKSVVLIPKVSLSLEVEDTWARALVEQARRVPLGSRLAPGRYLLRDSLKYDQCFELDHTAAQVIALCDGTRSVPELTKAVAHLLDIPYEEAADGVRNVLSFLSARALLEDTQRFRRKLRVWGNPFRLWRALRYVAAYRIWGKRTQPPGDPFRG